MSFSPDGNNLAVATSDGIELWTIYGDAGKAGTMRRILEGATVYEVSFSKDGKLIAVSRNMESITIWKETADYQMMSMVEQEGFFRSMAFSWDGKYFASGDHAGTIMIWDLLSGKKIKTLKGIGDWIDSIAFSPDGNQLVYAFMESIPAKYENYETEKIQIRNMESGGIRTLLDFEISTVFEAGFSPDGKILAIGINSDCILISVSNGQVVVALPGKENSILGDLDFSPDGKLLATSLYDWTDEPSQKPLIRIWDVDAALEINILLTEGDNIADIAFSPDGKLIASGTYTGTIGLWGVLS